MTFLWYMLEPDYDPGTAAETINRDLPRDGFTKALIFNMPALVNLTSGANTLLNYAAQIDQARIGVTESNRVSEIDGEDLFDFNILTDNSPYVENPTTDNNAQTIGMTYALDPFCVGVNVDYNQEYGISAAVARKVEILFAADAFSIDAKTLAIGVVVKTSTSGSTQGRSGGYTSFTRDTYTAANNVNNWTTVPQPGQFIGTYCFETNETTGQTALRSQNDIQQQAIAINRKDILGPVYPDLVKDFNGQYELGNMADEGHWFWNFGLRNEVGQLGLGPIPDKLEIRSLGGSDAGAVRVHAVRLNTNV